MAVAGKARTSTTVWPPRSSGRLESGLLSVCLLRAGSCLANDQQLAQRNEEGGKKCVWAGKLRRPSFALALAFGLLLGSFWAHFWAFWWPLLASRAARFGQLTERASQFPVALFVAFCSAATLGAPEVGGSPSGKEFEASEREREREVGPTTRAGCRWASEEIRLANFKLNWANWAHLWPSGSCGAEFMFFPAGCSSSVLLSSLSAGDCVWETVFGAQFG